MLDTDSTTLAATNLDQRAIETLPTGRNYSSIVADHARRLVGRQPRRTTAPDSTITVYGSSGAENAFYIDGVNTTNAEYGFQGKELNFEFIQEVDVKTGGYEAEFGRSTGGIINVITKSGGNEFHGDVFGYYDNDSLQCDAEAGRLDRRHASHGFTREDYGLDLGGYVIKDKLWFFAAYDRVQQLARQRAPRRPARRAGRARRRATATSAPPS